MKKKLVLFLCVVVAVLVLPTTAYADIGPKPSVTIRFDHMGSELCYGTLLSKEASVGPWSAGLPQEDVPEDLQRAFADYDDPDGYHFLNRVWNIAEEEELSWTYYPPDTFKILLYYPDSHTFLTSGICERYAFDTVYTVPGPPTGESLTVLQPHRNAYFGKLALRIVATVLIEMGVAWLYGFRQKAQYGVLLVANFATQLALNVLLEMNTRLLLIGPISLYVLLEFAIIAAEAAIYRRWLRRYEEKAHPGHYYTIYAVFANVVSFIAGISASLIFPRLG